MKYIICLMLMCLLSSQVLGYSIAVFENDTFARSSALSGALVADTKDPWSHMYNPAATAFSEYSAFSSSTYRMFDSSVNDISFVLDSDIGRLGVSYTRSSLTGLSRVILGADSSSPDYGRPLPGSGSFAYESSRLLVSIADMIRLDRWHYDKYLLGFGLQIESYNETLDTAVASAFIVNAGFTYLHNKYFSAGVVFKNILGAEESWTGGSNPVESLDMYQTIGFQYNIIPKQLSLYSQFSTSTYKSFSIGMEYQVSKEFAIQMSTGDAPLNLGTTISLSNFDLSYAYLSPKHELLEPSNRLTIAYRF